MVYSGSPAGNAAPCSSLEGIWLRRNENTFQAPITRGERRATPRKKQALGLNKSTKRIEPLCFRMCVRVCDSTTPWHLAHFGLVDPSSPPIRVVIRNLKKYVCSKCAAVSASGLKMAQHSPKKVIQTPFKKQPIAQCFTESGALECTPNPNERQGASFNMERSISQSALRF